MIESAGIQDALILPVTDEVPMGNHSTLARPGDAFEPRPGRLLRPGLTSVSEGALRPPFSMARG